MNKLYPADNDCLSRSRSWRAKLFTGRSRRPTALVATRGAAVTLKAPSTDRTYTSATGGRVERQPAIMCLTKAAENEVRRGVEAWNQLQTQLRQLSVLNKDRALEAARVKK